MRDYDSWKNGYYEAAYERDPGEEISHECRKKTKQDWCGIQDSFVELVKLIKTNPDQEKMRDYIDWLAGELHVDAKLFNMGLL